MIVRDEAAFLEGCLSSLRGHVDEFVVVDTGSKDGTPDIARNFDCKLLHQEWRHDFSTARNTALENASSDWILYIDADERLDCPEGVMLGQLLPGPEFAGARVRFQPRSDMTCYSEIRLFRRDPRIRFQGSIHESIMPALNLLGRQTDLKVSKQFRVSLFHLGYDGDQAHKHERNLPLLMTAIEEDPKRVYLRYHLGSTLQALGRDQEAARWLREGMELASRDDVPDQSLVEGTMCAQILAEIELASGKPQAALETVAAGHALFGENLALHWLQARCLVAARQVQPALALLEPISEIDADTFFDERIAYEKSLFREDVHGLIGAARFHAGDYAGACESYASALAFAPSSAELKAKFALSKARAGGSVVRQNS